MIVFVIKAKILELKKCENMYKNEMIRFSSIKTFSY